MKEKGSLKNWGHDKTSPSNLPQEVHHVNYPKEGQYGTELDDTMTGIDEVQDHGKGKMKKYLSNQK